MPSLETFAMLALSFPETEELPHFENTSYRVNKKIFATASPINNTACLKLSALEQSAFCSFDLSVMYPVPNKWGKQGWTMIKLADIKEEMLLDALTTAYTGVAPKRLSKPYKDRLTQL